MQKYSPQEWELPHAGGWEDREGPGCAQVLSGEQAVVTSHGPFHTVGQTSPFALGPVLLVQGNFFHAKRNCLCLDRDASKRMHSVDGLNNKQRRVEECSPFSEISHFDFAPFAFPDLFFFCCFFQQCYLLHLSILSYLFGLLTCPFSGLFLHSFYCRNREFIIAIACLQKVNLQCSK